MNLSSRSRLMWAMATALVYVMFAGRPAGAQTVTTGMIGGVISDAQGGVLPGATVTVTSLDTGVTRNIVTDQKGDYLVGSLPPGRYKVDVEMIGLGKATASDVDVLLGNTTKVDLKITPQISESVTVTAAAPVVDPARAATAVSVTNTQIENLPILGRDFRSLASLTPGITEAFGSRITANGARGLSTDYNIDGATSNNDFFGENTGGTRAPFTFSQAAIREFQVVRSQYDPEYGRGVGAQLNAVTKSGTNELHGEAFVFRRNASWAATRPTKLSSGLTATDSFQARDSTQPGFALGGPIVRSKAFYFVNFDSQRQKQPVAITSLNDRKEFQALSATLQQQFLSKLESILGHPYADELNYDTTYNQKTYLVKTDLNLGNQTRLSVRDNYTNFENGNNQSLNHRSNQGTEHDKFNQLVGQGTMVLSNNMTNEATVEFLTDQRPIEPVSGFPEIQISGITTGAQFFGQNDFLPNNTKETKTQVKDTLQYAIGRHTVKAGTDLLFMKIDNFFPRNANGVFLYSTPQAFVDGTVNSYRQGYGPGGGLTTWNQNTYAFYAADKYRANPRLTIDYGVRYDWQTMPKPAANIFPQHPEFVTQIKEDKNNIAPRLGVAYDLWGDGRTVVRGGVGKFFGYMPDILLSNPLTQISGNFNQITLTCSTATTVKCPTFPALLTAEQFNTLAKIGTDVVTISPDYQAQEAWRSSLQVERQIRSDYSAAAGFIYSKMTHVQGSRNINAVPTGILLGDLPVYDLVSASRPYTDMGVVRELCSCEEASFKSFTLETHRLASSRTKLSWDLSYTWSKSIDQDTNERSTSTSFLYDPNNTALSQGPSDNDVRHRIVGGAIYRLPFGIMASTIVTWRTGTPYTGGMAFTGTGTTANSLNGLSQMSGSIPLFVNASGTVIDLTAANNMSRKQFSDFLAAAGARIAGRNTVREPNYHVADVRFSKSFDLPRNARVEIIGEVFNILKTRIEQVTGTDQNQVRVTYNQTTDRYTFSSLASTYRLVNSYAGPDPRQGQVAVKFTF